MSLTDLFFWKKKSGGVPDGSVLRADHPAAIFAVGDIHGCFDQLGMLEARIAAEAAMIDGEKWLLTLGDVVDRGPSSARVIDHLLQPSPAGLRRINLMGNHEAMMLDFIERPRAGAMWLENGGLETLSSYGVPHDKLLRLNNRAAEQIVASYIPSEHVDYLRSLPVMLETPVAIFVHAGLRPGRPVDAQRYDDLLWFRDDFLADYAEFGKPVVHGHTMRKTPLVTPFRIAIDTGAVEGGPLTGVRISQDGDVKVLATALPEAALTIPGQGENSL